MFARQLGYRFNQSQVNHQLFLTSHLSSLTTITYYYMNISIIHAFAAVLWQVLSYLHFMCGHKDKIISNWSCGFFNITLLITKFLQYYFSYDQTRPHVCWAYYRDYCYLLHVIFTLLVTRYWQRVHQMSSGYVIKGRHES